MSDTSHDSQPTAQPTAQPNPQPTVQTHFESAGFPTPPPPQTRTLKISVTKNGAPLGKAQKTFNRLISQIERLRAKIAAEYRRLDDALQYHLQKLHPLKRQIAARRGEIAIFAHIHYKDSPATHATFSPNQRRVLRDFIAEQLRMIIDTEGGLPGEKLQAVYADIEGVTLDELRRRERDAHIDDLEAQMQADGLDIDLSAFRDDMTPEEFERAQADVAAQFKKAGLGKNGVPPDFRRFFSDDDPDDSNNPADAARARANATAPKPRKKTKKQLEREAREEALEEARARSLSTIYKQLARAFHPDLEPDPALKTQKEALMQQLTAAYRANDMHTLLRLELEWLQRDASDAARHTDEKLAIYNEVLREQVTALQNEHFTLSRHPRYDPLRPYAGAFNPFGNLARLDLSKAEAKLKSELTFLNTVDITLTGTGAVKKLKEIIRDYTAEAALNDRELSMDRMMRQAMSDIMDDMMPASPRRPRPPRW